VKYLLDTCAISDFVKGDKNTLKHLKNTSPSDIAVSSITLMEIQYGLALNQARAASLKNIIKDFLQSIVIVDFGKDDALQSAIIRAFLKEQGNPIGSYDILIAGTALNYKLTLVSSNLKEFVRVNGLQIENWRD